MLPLRPPIRVKERHGLSDLFASMVLSLRLLLPLREPAVHGIGVDLSVHGRILPAYVTLLLSRTGMQRQLLESLLKPSLLAEHIRVVDRRCWDLLDMLEG